MAATFTRLIIRPFYALHQAALEWQVSDGPPYGRFTIFRSPNGYGDWERLGQVQDGNQFVDYYAAFPGRFAEWYYKVIREEENGEFSQSDIVATLDQLDRREFGATRLIMRQELVAMRQFATFILLKQKVAGPPCPTCMNTVTDQDYGSSMCRTCYGSRIDGGFQNPVSLHARQMSTEDYQRLDSAQGAGSDDPMGLEYRFLAFPSLAKDDMLVESDIDRRYLVSTITNYQAFGKAPTINVARLTMLNASDVRHRLPISAVQYGLLDKTGHPVYQGPPQPVPVPEGTSLVEATKQLPPLPDFPFSLLFPSLH